MRVSLISSTVLLIVFCSTLATAATWDDPLQFCAKKALAIAENPKCKWASDVCFEKNKRASANISKFMCTNTFTMRKLGDFCCNESLDDLVDIVNSTSGSRRRRSKAHPKRSSSSSNEFDQWISSYLS
ncbi:hypothetical protein PRIPAC_76259 [Pristionchus pacificus]|uniref:Uncharacterized protein n=1 Tax=Pristionchus pacificus TaxID=54126 RepID=A0A2A6CR94_PRIPA|nr:hypothetical protein PRIPAC_76259 [Pristionchus pacificus]|eukprot:PDM80551.1 hypothetical protein PRIPAC_35554 [Pristionchus pacificus]